jgi:CheY-like chemotaxis protein
VEDNADIGKVLRLACEAGGYATQTVADGVEALAWLHACADPHIVVLDYHMLRLDGWAVLSAVVADPALAGAGHAFILLTVASLPPAFDGLLREMAAPVAAKPNAVLQLHRLLADATDKIRRDENGCRTGAGAATSMCAWRSWSAGTL